MGPWLVSDSLTADSGRGAPIERFELCVVLARVRGSRLSCGGRSSTDDEAGGDEAGGLTRPAV